MREINEGKGPGKLTHNMESGKMFAIPVDFAEFKDEDLLKWCKTIYISFVQNSETSPLNQEGPRGVKLEDSNESENQNEI